MFMSSKKTTHFHILASASERDTYMDAAEAEGMALLR
jgi:hypothetical protein